MNIILLSGGSGKRLWPLSNDVRSKQFIEQCSSNNDEYQSMVQRVYCQITTAEVLTQRSPLQRVNLEASAIKNQLGEKAATLCGALPPRYVPCYRTGCSISAR